MVCSFNKIFALVRYLFWMRAYSIVLKASISVGIKRFWWGWRMFSSATAGTWSLMAFLIPSSLLIFPGSSLFSSIFISQASFPSLLEEDRDDMMPDLDNPGRKHIETKTGDICVIRWSKPLGDYIMNFYRPKYVTCKKTESGRHTRWPRDRGSAQEGWARPPPSWRPRVLPGLLLIFLFF